MNAIAPVASRASKLAPRQPENLVAKVFGKYGTIDGIVTRRIKRGASPTFYGVSIPPYVNETIRQRHLEQHRCKAKEYLDEIEVFGTIDDLTNDLNELTVALEHDADEKTVRAILALMLDALPAAAAQVSATYIDALVLTLQIAMADDETTLSAYVLCNAIRRIWLNERFAPSAGDLVAAMRGARNAYAVALSIVFKTLRDRAIAQAALADGDARPPLQLTHTHALALAERNATPVDDEDKDYDRGL